MSSGRVGTPTHSRAGDESERAHRADLAMPRDGRASALQQRSEAGIVCPTRGQTRPIAHRDDILAVDVWFDLRDAVDVDDRRTVYAHEAPRVEATLDRLHRVAIEVGAPPRVQPYVIPAGVGPLDAAGGNDEHARPAPHAEPR